MSRLSRTQLADILQGIPLNGYQNRIKVAVTIAKRPVYEVAAKAGLNYSRFSQIAQGHREPTLAEREAIARAIGVPMSVLFPLKAVA